MGRTHCRLTTVDWRGRPVETHVRAEPSSDRLYVRASGEADWVGRLWNTPAVWITPCTRLGRARGRPRLSQARVLPAAGEHDELLIELLPTNGAGRAA